MPSVIQLLSGDKIYTTQEPEALATAATENVIIAVNVEGKPDVYVAVASIATITQGRALSRRASFA